MNDIHIYTPGQIFVFGSNLLGMHGGGAARFAYQNGLAKGGIGVGRSGAFSYAIPTKDENIETMPLDQIFPHVQKFLEYAKKHSAETFFVTALGTGLAGYTHDDIAPMFQGVSSNCIMPPEWRRFQIPAPR